VSSEIDFEWERDREGYELLPGWLKDLPTNLIVPLDPVKGDDGGPLAQPRPYGRIVRRGGELVRYRPFERTDGLFTVFLGAVVRGGNRVRTEGLLDFVQRFGPLTRSGNGPVGEDVRIGLSEAEQMSELVAQHPEERAVRLVQQGDRSLASVEVRLGLHQLRHRPQLFYRPTSLIEAMRLELGFALTSDATLRRCEFCGNWFEAGRGTGRREDAKFCSDQHRIDFNSQKRAKGR
jgi:hypothetical protein